MSNFAEEFTELVPTYSPAAVPKTADRVFKVCTSIRLSKIIVCWGGLISPATVPKNADKVFKVCMYTLTTSVACGGHISPATVSKNDNKVLKMHMYMMTVYNS